MSIGDKVHSLIAPASGVLCNGQNYVNHPLTCIIALELQQVDVDDGLLAQVRQHVEQLRSCLKQGLSDLDIADDVGLRGLLAGVEFVENRATKTPFRGGREVAPVV